MSNQITTTQQNVFAVSDRDRKAARVLKMMLPYGGVLTDDNAMALLVYGRIHDLDPLNQECYFLVRERRNERGEVTKREELGCYPGIKGKRKKAREQAHFKVEYSITDPKVLGLNEADISICIKAELRDDKSTGEYIVNALKLTQAGFSREEVDKIIGKPPVVTGYGMVKKSELNYIKMEPVKLARKRAENDAITQRFDLPLSDALPEDDAPEMVVEIDGPVDNEQIAANVEDGDFTAAVSAAPKKTEQELMRDLGF